MPEYKGEKLADDKFNDFAFGFLAFTKTRETDGIYEGTGLEPSTGPNSKAVKANSSSIFAVLDDTGRGREI
ncbi:hypothetical protein C8R43DRAFT_1116101 [Mycena crocata]|nr:hypothetical protein C8R43DRAFT_1116101 [Mycena crocata]